MAGGRPSKYKPEFPKQAFKLALLGATDKQVADFFEVNVDSIKEWKNVHKEFSAALKAGKENADSIVAASLFKRAKGFHYEEVTNEEAMVGSVSPDGKLIKVPGVVVKRVRKLVIPDTIAQIFWLKNRQPELWRDKHEVKHDTPEGQVFVINGKEMKF